MSLLKDIWYVTVLGRKSQWLGNPFAITAKLFLLGLCIQFCFSVVQTVLIHLELVPHVLHPTLSSIVKFREEPSIIAIIFVATVFTHPLIEELSFRMCLSKKSRSISFGLGFLVSFFIVLFFDLGWGNDLMMREISFLCAFFSISIILGLVIDTFFKKWVSIFLRKSVFSLMILCSAVLFAIAHFEVSGVNSLLSAFNVLPYFFSAYIFSYLKLIAGFKFSFCLHSLINSFFFLATYIFG